MKATIFLDESGDLGWTFDKPYRTGGSSRFLTIAYILVPFEAEHKVKRLVRKYYNKYHVDPNVEVKGNSIPPARKQYLVSQILKLLQSEPDMILGAITVNKEGVEDHIKTDGNKLYNYMISKALLRHMVHFKEVFLIRDERAVKMASGNSCGDYLQTQLWFKHKRKTMLHDMPMESHANHNLIFIDWVSYMVWSYYENGDEESYEKLKPRIHLQEMYFS